MLIRIVLLISFLLNYFGDPQNPGVQINFALSLERQIKEFYIFCSDLQHVFIINQHLIVIFLCAPFLYAIFLNLLYTDVV